LKLHCIIVGLYGRNKALRQTLKKVILETRLVKTSFLIAVIKLGKNQITIVVVKMVKLAVMGSTFKTTKIFKKFN
jgi:hypothetical protein